MFQYFQKTGMMRRIEGVSDYPFALGYSGHGEGKNNPDMEQVSNIGPLPRGKFTMQVIEENGIPVDYEGKAAPVIRLIPNSGTQMFGRAGMLIHGDFRNQELQGTASHGCVIENHSDRLRLAQAIRSGDNQLEVV